MPSAGGACAKRDTQRTACQKAVPSPFSQGGMQARSRAANRHLRPCATMSRQENATYTATRGKPRRQRAFEAPCSTKNAHLRIKRHAPTAASSHAHWGAFARTPIYHAPNSLPKPHTSRPRPAPAPLARPDAHMISTPSSSSSGPAPPPAPPQPCSATAMPVTEASAPAAMTAAAAPAAAPRRGLEGLSGAVRSRGSRAPPAAAPPWPASAAAMPAAAPIAAGRRGRRLDDGIAAGLAGAPPSQRAQCLSLSVLETLLAARQLTPTP